MDVARKPYKNKFRVSLWITFKTQRQNLRQTYQTLNNSYLSLCVTFYQNLRCKCYPFCYSSQTYCLCFISKYNYIKLRATILASVRRLRSTVVLCTYNVLVMTVGRQQNWCWCIVSNVCYLHLKIKNTYLKQCINKVFYIIYNSTYEMFKKIVNYRQLYVYVYVFYICCSWIALKLRDKITFKYNLIFILILHLKITFYPNNNINF